MSMETIKKADGTSMTIIDGEYVIGANSGCFSDVNCKKIINGQYVITDCLDCSLLESLDCFVNITLVEQFKEIITIQRYWSYAQDEVTFIEALDFFDRITLHENKILDIDSVFFNKLNCFITLKENKEVDFYDIDEAGVIESYHSLIKNNTVLMFGGFDGLYEHLETAESIIISNNSVMHKIEVPEYVSTIITKPILQGDYYIHINYKGVIDIALKNSTNETLYILDLGH